MEEPKKKASFPAKKRSAHLVSLKKKACLRPITGGEKTATWGRGEENLLFKIETEEASYLK